MSKPTLYQSFRSQTWLLLLVAGCTARVPSANAEQSAPPPSSAAARLNDEPTRKRDESREGRRDELDVITNSIDMKLVLIPDGDYLTGSPETEHGRVRFVEGPRRRVWITEPFHLGVYEVTVGQFRQFVEDANYQTEPERDGEGGWGWNKTRRVYEGRSPKYTWRNPGFLQTDTHPVVNVTWNDAVAFCRWLSDVEGEEYRLPTEAEWEYACRAGTTTAYYHGDDPAGLAQVGNVAGVAARMTVPATRTVPPRTTVPDCTAVSARDGYVATLPVGRFLDNEFGLHDMHGNVWEWCADWYDLSYYRRSPEENPAGAAYGSLRVSRGGSWNIGPRSCRSASRNAFGPGTRSHDQGFRVALGPAPPEQEHEPRHSTGTTRNGRFDRR
ncbi:MAG: formylglycine-generating enzyme family protein [Patescibacteria group bacterium]|nr:formylglycine-generating enzyme family protein [Patescibacteria group bacterium]